MKVTPRLFFALPVVISIFTLFGMATRASAQDTYPTKMGTDLDFPGDGNRAKTFIDLGRSFRGWMQIDSQAPAPIDEHDWPTADAKTVLFDIRPFSAWAPPIDDPDAFQPDWSGTYKLSFHGQAALDFTEDTTPQIANQKYDPATNITTADLVIPKGTGLCCINFKQTKRTADAATGSGITGLKVIRPGYDPNTTAIFTDEFLASLKPFAVLRFMDWLETNHNPGFYSDPGHHVLEWADRHTLDDATVSDFGTKKYGVPWEYIIELAKISGKDIWINIPVAASDDYVKNLAQLLKANLPATTNIYIEHSNEVWNFSFPQYTYNKLAAADEVKAGNSVLNKDGATDPEVWTHRRHAERLVTIGNIFRDTFGPNDAARIRPIYASWLISVNPHFADVLEWVDKTYGAPKDYFYGIADAAYFNVEKAPKDADVAALLSLMRKNSDDNMKYREPLQSLAERYGLKHCQYEVGPDTGGGKTDNIANRIEVNRDPGMKDLIIHDARDNWFSHGGDLYMYFQHIGPYSRHGAWGLSEDIANLNTPKWQAIYDLTGATPPPAPPATTAPPAGATPPAPAQ